MKHLFKLKKDGKTVGYLELRIRTQYGYPVLWFRNLGRLDEGREWHSGNNIQADSIHPFVTKDKHGDDVFAGDSVKSGKLVLTIVWGESNLRWMAQQEDERFQTPLCQWAISEQFELIKE